MPGVEGRVALVTGAGRGIGRVTAELLASRGARVMAVARSENELQTLGLDYVVADLGTPDGCTLAVEETQDRLGPVAILVCNHGIGSAHERVIWEQEPELWRETMRINLDGPYFLSRLVVKDMIVSKKASSGATTHPEFCAGIITFLQKKGFQNISILEGSWVGDRTKKAFKVCGYSDISKKYSVPLVDLQQDTSVLCEGSNGEYRICQSILELDRLINIPVLKGHCQTAMTCALKNLKGCIPNSEKQRYHREGLFQAIADLNEILKSDLILVDAMEGDPSFEEGGNPFTLNLFMAALDPVLLDRWTGSG